MAAIRAATALLTQLNILLFLIYGIASKLPSILTGAPGI